MRRAGLVALPAAFAALVLWSAPALACLGGAARAQSPPPPTKEAMALALVARGDTMLIAGRLFGAESAYYAAVRLAPHEGDTRLALGRYLAGRGRLRIAATLMEEARHFGVDPKVVAMELAPVYARLGIIDSLAKRIIDWSAFAALPAPAVGVGERLRAEYLRANPPEIDGPDSAIVLYTVTDSHLLGRTRLIVAGDTVFAVIDARVSGLLLDTAWMHHDSVKRFAPRGSRDPAATFGVVARVQIGDIVLGNAPVRFQPMRTSRDALIGLDVLGALAATFDPRVGYMMLRRSGRVSDSLPGWRIPSYMGRTGVLVVKGETMFPIGHPDVQQYFRVGKWTWDSRRGEVVIDSVGVKPDTTKTPAS